MQKPRLNFAQIWNMSFGFLGIQFGWGLQMANMSPIYKYLNARDDQIPLLWLAAPLTGFLVQPIIGAMSDRTWGRLGRRRSYFSDRRDPEFDRARAHAERDRPLDGRGAALDSRRIDQHLDGTVPRLRGDNLPEEQRATGFTMQSLFIGAGAVIAGLLPWVLKHLFGVTSETSAGNAIPPNVKYAFYIGAAAFFGAVMWTVLTSKEYPPEDMAEFRCKKPSAGTSRISWRKFPMRSGRCLRR